MKKAWEYFTDKFGSTIFHPQFIMNSYKEQAIEKIKKYGKGKLVDIGCGRSPYKETVLNFVDSYTGVDHPETAKLYESDSKPDFYADAHKLPFKNNSYETAIMLQVLEYLDNPQKAITEVARVIKKNGVFILSAPFMYPIHDGKFDHSRFTESGVTSLLSEAKLKIIDIESQGNFWDFWFQSILVYYFKSTMSLSKNRDWKLLSIPLLLTGLAITPFLNLLALLSRNIEEKSDFPLNIIAVAKK